MINTAELYHSLKAVVLLLVISIYPFLYEERLWSFSPSTNLWKKIILLSNSLPPERGIVKNFSNYSGCY